ncbi:hypothetical protein OTK49_21415 [Vibrio coralliirubri]|uniref:hypothetical protein n=1 Tax=Vibrio coralliirubri TaxID=1516159 RepID=UPI00228477A4|nr:hypothetical protein [Vibrio coralliirubri]MCY9865081.1 hypothetical protein [Vibrio coralliirubri]
MNKLAIVLFDKNQSVIVADTYIISSDVTSSTELVTDIIKCLPDNGAASFFAAGNEGQSLRSNVDSNPDAIAQDVLTILRWFDIK